MPVKFMNGVDLQNQKAILMASPSTGTDGANKQYVDDKINGLMWKPAVRAATTTNGTLATAYSTGQVVDGVTLALGDRILVKNQTTGSENGIYTVANGAPIRATDADSAGEIGPNTTVYVSEGTVQADTAWTLTNNGVITIGTTALVWAQVPSSGGAGVSDGSKGDVVVSGSGTVWTVNKSTFVVKYAANIGNGSLTTITINHALNTADITCSFKIAATGEIVYPDVFVVDANNITATFGVAPGVLAIRAVVHG